MTNKVGSIVAIEPSTGEILCYVSSPTYDPNLLVGRERGNNAAKLYKDPYKPFFTRPVQAYYPPGSSFKPLSALIAMQEGVITPQTVYHCPGITRRVTAVYHVSITKCMAMLTWPVLLPIHATGILIWFLKN
jgi:cell division protein FtsI/penicillin-binding protein 2